jgi:hypothetical protein
MHLEIVESESTFSYMRATRTYIERHGKPVAFYSDKHGAFRNNVNGTIALVTGAGRMRGSGGQRRCGSPAMVPTSRCARCHGRPARFTTMSGPPAGLARSPSCRRSGSLAAAPLRSSVSGRASVAAIARQLAQAALIRVGA